MRAFVLYSPSKNELSLLSSVFDFLMKKRGTFQCPECAQKLSQLERCLDDPAALKLLVCDVTTEGVLPLLEQLRCKNQELKLVLVADGSVPPVRYIRPTILPTSLLWRPLKADGVRDALWEVLVTIPKEDQTNADQTLNSFCIEVRGDVRRIPYRDILFFEAGNKRLNLNMNRKVIPFTGTLEKLAEELPEEFIRVHKSFIVNRNAITQIQFGQNLVILEGGISVPVSRSYKSMLKAVFS